VAAFLRPFAAALATLFLLDLLWLGLVARDFYRSQLGHLLRADVAWAPALLFYLLFVAALVVFVVQPAVERQSLGRALWTGAFFGLTAYATYDLTSLALIRDFPLGVALVDLAWGTALSAAAAAAGWWAAMPRGAAP
jgi:uncharacterized membrane protein